MKKDQTKIFLDEKDMPTKWYNILADLQHSDFEGEVIKHG